MRVIPTSAKPLIRECGHQASALALAFSLADAFGAGAWGPMAVGVLRLRSGPVLMLHAAELRLGPAENRKGLGLPL